MAYIKYTIIGFYGEPLNKPKIAAFGYTETYALCVVLFVIK